MITKYKKHHRIIATFFLLIFFPTIVPSNLFASNNGPKSPEAASFEPVDATDMVNLITGQYSYVLPLLNVPSPEGGYPLALGYHAGITLDQESSWTGLGWNVNPGAIDRYVNGYPDDYESSTLNEYFYDSGGKETQNYVSVGYSNGALSLGLGFNWGSNQSLGGFVGAGYGFNLEGTGISVGVNEKIGFGSNSGQNSFGMGVGVSMKGGLSFGLMASSDEGLDANTGFNNNGSGFSISTSGSANLMIGTGNKFSAIGMTLSSSGGHATVGGAGAGISLSFNSTVNMGKYSTDSNGWNAFIPIPTSYGVFSLSFGHQEFTYWLNNNVTTYVSGPLKYNQVNYIVSWYDPNTFVQSDGGRRSTSAVVNGVRGYYTVGGSKSFDSSLECTDFITKIGQLNPTYVFEQKTAGDSAYKDFKSKFFDIYETPVVASDLDVTNNNITFPNYDGFSVQAQGLSGSMKARVYENGTLFGLSDRDNSDGYMLKYYNDNDSNIDVSSKFDGYPIFYFDNEISSYLNVNPAQFNQNYNNSLINNFYSTGVELVEKPRRKTSTFIEYYTNNQIINSYDFLKSKGYLQANVTGFDRNLMPKNGVGAFNITTADGKTYHYSLPVYNHEIVTRTFGSISPRIKESESYFEKRQFEPYATHWLLTAVTGPDFVDNGDGIAGAGDLGYWTSFEYGKWSDAFVWKTPFKKDFIVNSENPDIKTWIRGRKQLYYLDKIKTRSHTALFLKSERTDSPSEIWNYNSVIESNGSVIDCGPYIQRMSIPGQNQLKLDKIILLKNENDNVDKKYGYDSNLIASINYNRNYPSTIGTNRRGATVITGYVDNKIEDAKYNIYDNVLDTGDNWQNIITKAVKVIDFDYDYSLVPGDNRLTLRSIDFKGKAGTSVLPPYRFDYINDTNTFSIDNKDGWGYLANKPETFSLNKITTPQGGTINIQYEKNKFISPTTHRLDFSISNKDKFTCTLPSYSSTTDVNNKKVIIDVGSNNEYSIPLNQPVSISDYGQNVCINSDIWYFYRNFGSGHISAILGNGKYEVQFDTPPTCQSKLGYCEALGGSNYKNDLVIRIYLENNIFTGAGIRTKSLKISDGINNYFTDYKYGQNEDGIGYASYVPYSQNVVNEVPYSAELPAPRAMYEYVAISSHKEGFLSDGKVLYKFNVMKSKDKYKTKFGDFYEIIENKQASVTNSSKIDVNVSAFTVKDNLANIGQLLEVVTFNGKGQQLSKISNTYYGMNDNATNMGVSQESYQTYKTVDYLSNTSAIKDKWIINSSTRIKYPSIIKSSTEQTSGYSYTTQFNDYDLISGISKEQVYTSSDGQSFKTKTVPAYKKYSEMGSKVDNIGNKNMLSQTAANYSYILDKGTNSWKETGVGITTWSNIWSYKDVAGTTVSVLATAPAKDKIWRKHKSYIWNGVKDTNGIFTNYDNINGSKDDKFVWTVGVGSQPTQWKQTSEVTLYDHFSVPLEMKDINGNYASTKMGDGDTKVMATGNAGYSEMFFAGAENLKPTTVWLEPEVQMTNALRNSAYSHTGKQSVAATSGSQFGVSMKNLEHRAGKYKVSVWVEKSNAAKATLKVNGSIVLFQSDAVLAGNWQLKTAYITVPAGACTVYLSSADTSTVYFDDLMIRPVASSITGYVYNEWDELTHIIGNNGLATRFEYDAAGRLVKTYSEIVDYTENGVAVTGGFKLASENGYNYKKPL